MKSREIGTFTRSVLTTASAPVSAVYIIKYLIQQPYGTTLILYGEYINKANMETLRETSFSYSILKLR